MISTFQVVEKETVTKMMFTQAALITMELFKPEEFILHFRTSYLTTFFQPKISL